MLLTHKNMTEYHPIAQSVCQDTAADALLQQEKDERVELASVKEHSALMISQDDAVDTIDESSPDGCVVIAPELLSNKHTNHTDSQSARVNMQDELLGHTVQPHFCSMYTDVDVIPATVVLPPQTVSLEMMPPSSSHSISIDTDIDVSMHDTDIDVSMHDTDAEFDLTDAAYKQAGYFNFDRPGTPVPSSYTLNPSQMSSCSDIMPVCRFCQQREEENDPLFAPCRCAGSLQYIHHSCLLRWIEICTKKSRKPPTCEICEYQFHRHKTFKIRQWKFPRVTRQDKCLHVVFILNILIMIGCATATVMCFLSDKGHISKFPKNRMHLSTEEIITLSCGVLFFVSFFIAMSVEIKAKHNIYKLFVKFFLLNISWEIEEYDKRRDIEERILFNKEQHKV